MVAPTVARPAGHPSPGPSAGPAERPHPSGAGPAGGTASGTAGRPAASGALAAYTLCSAAGLFRVFSGAGWIPPVLITALAVGALSWVLRRRHTPAAASLVASVVALVLVSVWTVLGRYTFYGFLTAGTWDHAVTALRALGNEIASQTVPVRPSRGFELLAAAGAGVAAAVADAIAFRLRSPLAALIPGLAIFICCCSVGDGRFRAGVVAAALAGACFFLLVERLDGSGPEVWFAGLRPRLDAGIPLGGIALCLAAVAAAVAITPALPAHDGTGVLGWKTGIGSNGGERIVPNPLVDLQTRLTTLSQVPVFRVSSSAPSYWRLTSLDHFDGQTWTSTGSYRGFGRTLPGSLPPGPGVRSVTASFTIEQLESPWLPAQFSPVSVTGLRGITFDPDSNSLLVAGQTADGLHYTVTSYQFLDSLTAQSLEQAPPVSLSDPAALNQTELPPQVPDRVYQLAYSLTNGLPNEYAKALAIESYLRGPLFRYTLDPPSDGPGADALEQFLFVTRQGYCQQFAGAFAVLARAAGLPARLAVGFATGIPVEANQFQVVDGDAHTWPEVYFGPRYGWVPFEPTPGFAVPGTSGYTTPLGGVGPTSPGPNPITTPTTGNAGSPTTLPKQRPNSVAPTTVPFAPTPAHRPPAGAALWWLALPAAGLAWVGVCAFGPAALQRRRRRREDRAGAPAAVIGAWQEVARDLAWRGLVRHPAETDDEFARRAEAALRGSGTTDRWRHGGLTALAALARAATYAPTLPAGAAPAARSAAGELRDALNRSLSPAARLRRVGLPGALQDELRLARGTPHR